MTTNHIDPLTTELNQETAQIPWRELQRFFANGSALVVDSHLDLLEVAAAMARDRSEQVKQWLHTGKLGPVADHQAQEWYQSNAQLWALVIKPWVLVQESQP